MYLLIFWIFSCGVEFIEFATFRQRRNVADQRTESSKIKKINYTVAVVHNQSNGPLFKKILILSLTLTFYSLSL